MHIGSLNFFPWSCRIRNLNPLQIPLSLGHLFFLLPPGGTTSHRPNNRAHQPQDQIQICEPGCSAHPGPTVRQIYTTQETGGDGPETHDAPLPYKHYQQPQAAGHRDENLGRE